MKTPINIEAFLDQTFFGLDTQAMLCDVEDFINFSEANIARQKKRELLRAKHECDEEVFEDADFAAQYRDQKIQGVGYRFEVSLTQRVRYAGLTSLITTLEWVLLALKNRTLFQFPEKPKGKSEAVHILEVFDQKASLGLQPKIESLENLVQVRNCIVHSAGLLSSYRHEVDLRKRLTSISGVKVSDINFLGDGVEIEASFLQDFLEDVKKWLPKLEKSISEQGLLRP